jgi:glycosyltransferase involved in cell wall biosynthesis
MGNARILITADAVGGVWSHTVELLAGLAATEFVPILAVIGPPPSADHTRELRLRVPACDVIEVGGAPEWLAPDERTAHRTAAHIGRLAENLDVDLVHLSQPSIAGSVVFSVPVVAVCHSCLKSWFDAVRGTELPADMEWRHALIRTGLKRADVCVAPSASFAATLQTVHGLAERPHVILNGREPETITDTPGRDVAVFAGRLWDDAKNVRTLDAAAAHLPFPIEAAGAIAGPNGAAVTLTRVRQLGSLGRERMVDLFAQRPILVSPAVYEPFGLTVLEGAQAGCALVLSDIPTFRELWDGAALFIDPNDPMALADTLRSVMRDRSWRDELGTRARHRSTAYGGATMAAAYAALYRKLTFLRQAPPVKQQTRAA